ncbi:MAG: nucleoside triphosphate pyrophosphohydrolase [bacterium]
MKEENQSTLFQTLSQLVARLRRECPWDREQTHESLKPFLLQEAFETAEAVESGDPEKLEEELGDLLLMILLYAEISQEFAIGDVLSRVIHKMRTRHPHVFGQEKLASSKQVIERWEEIKRETRKGKAESALDKAALLNDRAIRAGFNPPSLQEMAEKLNEEIGELKRAETHKEKKEESGDLLFTSVNICRMLKVEPESALLEACSKFEKRLRKVFKELQSRGRDPRSTPFQKMDEIWNEIK